MLKKTLLCALAMAASAAWADVYYANEIDRSVIAVQPTPILNGRTGAGVGFLYEARVTDGDLKFAVNRWMQSGGYKVVWEVPPIRVSKNTAFLAHSPIDAANLFLEQAKKEGLLLSATVYEGRLIRFQVSDEEATSVRVLSVPFEPSAAK